MFAPCLRVPGVIGRHDDHGDTLLAGFPGVRLE